MKAKYVGYVGLAALLGALSAGAATNATAGAASPQQADQAKRRAALRERALRSTGGTVTKPGKGYVAIVDAQRAVSKAAVEEGIRNFAHTTSLDCRYAAAPKDAAAGIGAFKVPKGAAAAIFVVDDPSLPMSLVANEAHWGMVNVSHLLHGQPDAALLKDRLGKQFTRIMAMTIGCGREAQYRDSVFAAVSDAQGLDSLPTKNLSNDAVGGIVQNGKVLGLEPRLTTVYRRAVQEGWAPAPTNECQKAVWDKFHAMPAAPIKIRPETKKVAE